MEKLVYAIWNHKNVLCVAITACATACYFLIWMRMAGQLRHADNRSVFVLFLFIDERDKESAEPRLESFCPPFVAGIHLPYQGVVDYHSLPWDWMSTTRNAFAEEHSKIQRHIYHFKIKTQHVKCWYLSEVDLDPCVRHFISWEACIVVTNFL